MINKAFNGYGLGLSDSLVEASKKVVESSAAYKKFFDSVLKKFGVTSPAELDGAKKKEFFAYVEDNWNSEDEEGKDGKKEEVKEGELPPALKKAIAKKKGEDDSEDKEEVKEGELPPALQKAIDKKKGKEDDSEDKED
jgi:hypothetical protein|tara:strand:+ start:232 stop:645 length:414 start_codon:yes stop_codon:yes gene_type:complete